MGQTVAKIAVGLPLIWYNGPSSHQAALKTLQDNGLTTDYNQVNAFLLQPQLSPVLNSVPFNIDSEKRTFVLRFDGFDPNNVDTSSDHWYDQIIGDYAGGDFYLGLYNKVQLDLKTLTLGLPCQPQAYTGSLLTVSLNVNGQGPGLHRIDYLLSYENCIGPADGSADRPNRLLIAGIIRAVDTSRLVPDNMETIYDRTYRVAEAYADPIDAGVFPPIKQVFQQNFGSTFRFPK